MGKLNAETGKDALAGAGTGAAIGSAFSPIGTVIGGAAGGLIGGAIGFFGQGDSNDPSQLQQEQAQALQQDQAEQQALLKQLGGDLTGAGAGGEALGLMKGAAEGNAPSQAEVLMNQGVQSTMGGVFGLAGAGNGVSPALALRQAMMQAGATAMSGVSQNAALRASEMATARSNYIQAVQQNENMQASLLGGGAAGTAANSATQLALPGAQANATLGNTLLGGALNMGGAAISRGAQAGAGNVNGVSASDWSQLDPTTRSQILAGIGGGTATGGNQTPVGGWYGDNSNAASASAPTSAWDG